MFIYFTDGGWYSVNNGSVSASSLTAATDRIVAPAGVNNPADSSIAPEDKFTGASVIEWQDPIPNAGLSPTPGANIHPTPGTNDAYIMMPCPVIFFDPQHQVVLELSDVFWVSGFGSIGSEDRNIVSGQVYRIFQNCNRTDNWTFLAVKEV